MDEVSQIDRNYRNDSTDSDDELHYWQAKRHSDETDAKALLAALDFAALIEKSRADAEIRKTAFADYYEEAINEEGSIFNLPGLQMKVFNSERVKFRFWPHDIVNNVLETVSFFCVMWYDGTFWHIKRNSFPVNYKSRIYKLFRGRKCFTIIDNRLTSAIYRIYDFLVEWSRDVHIWKENKYKRYLEGYSDVEFNDDDAQIFLTAEEQEVRAQRIHAIHQRMIPPKRKKATGRQLRPRR